MEFGGYKIPQGVVALVICLFFRAYFFTGTCGTCSMVRDLCFSLGFSSMYLRAILFLLLDPSECEGSRDLCRAMSYSLCSASVLWLIDWEKRMSTIRFSLRTMRRRERTPRPPLHEATIFLYADAVHKEGRWGEAFDPLLPRGSFDRTSGVVN